MGRAILGLGLMSGTSMDGIDAVLASFSPSGDETLVHISHAYSSKLREMLFQKTHSPQLSLEEYGIMDFLVGEAFAAAALKCLKQAKQKRLAASADVIGSHGQTIFHNPSEKVSLQIGSPQVIASKTGITTVSNFRMADIIAEGEGAPFLPYYHRKVIGRNISKNGSGFALNNLGGIANFTYFGPAGKLIALDTGPASCMMDMAMQVLSQGKLRFDKNGAWARAGKCAPKLLDFLKNIPAVKEYRARPAPKSTGRELFTQSLTLQFIAAAQKENLSKENMLATLAQFSVDLMVEAYERFIVKKHLPLKAVIFCGGGAYNSFLLEVFARAMPGVRVSTLEEFGIAPQAIEAQAFACYGIMAIAGLPQNLPAATGAHFPVVGGEITPGKNWKGLYLKVYSSAGKSVSKML